MYPATDIVLIIGAVFTGISTTIIAIKQNKNEKHARVVARRVRQTAPIIESIHSNTNGTLTDMKNTILKLERRNHYLEKLLNELIDHSPPGALKTARDEIVKVETDVGGRRRGDYGLPEEQKEAVVPIK